MINVGVIGYGYWGPNLVRNFAANPAARVVAVADPRPEAQSAVTRSHSSVVTCTDADELLAMENIDAVVVATPVTSHYALAAKAIDRGKHVLVEKPLARSSDEGRDLVRRAERAGLVLMVDHTFLFTGAVQTMRDIVRRGDLGKICYFDSMRVNLGLFRPDVNCLWDLAPHDLSIIEYLGADKIVGVDATGYGHIDPARPDMVFLTLHYANDLVAHFNLSWMSPVKIRRFMVGGTERMLIWDDLDQDQKIKLYDHGISFHAEEDRAAIIPQYRIGSILSPRVPRGEALAGVAEHFLEVIRGEVPSLMDGSKGVRILEILEDAQRQLDISLSNVARQRGSAPTMASEGAGQ